MTERKEKEDGAARAGWESRVTPLDFFFLIRWNHFRPLEVKLKKRERIEEAERKRGCRRRLPQRETLRR